MVLNSSPPQFWHRAGERRGPPSPLPAQPAAGRTSGEAEEERDGPPPQRHHHAAQR